MNNYEKNIRALDKFQPALGQKIRMLGKKSKALEALSAKNGQATVRKNGCLLHSVYDPQREAEIFIDKFEFRGKNNIFVLGFALGYHIDEILKRNLDFSRIFIVEPDIRVFQCALRARDLTRMFKNERIIFFIGLDPQRFFEVLIYKMLVIMSAKISIMEYPPSIAVDQQYFEEIRKKIADAVRASASNIVTLNYANRFFIENVTVNLSEAVMSVGLKQLFNKFSAVPAVIVSAGPSLDKNVELLKKAKGRCLILATDTSFKILLQHNIKPDLVFTEDFKKISRLHFENIKINDVPLVFDMQAAPASLAAYKSERFVAASTRPFPLIINKLTENKGVVSMGMSVAHFAFNAAIAFDCDPIIFIGQDLSFTDGFSHARGTSSREKIAAPVKKSRKFMQVKSSLTGQDLLTNNAMYIYLRHFESIIAGSRRTCINATEGGVGIKGTGVMKLREAIRKYCTKDIQISEIIRQARISAPQPDVGMVVKNVEDLIRRIKKVKKASAEIMEILEQVFKLSQEQGSSERKISRHLTRLKAPAAKVMSEEDILMIIHADLLEHMMQQRSEGRLDSAQLKKIEFNNLAVDFKDDFEFQKAVYQGSSFLEKCLDKSLLDLKALRNNV